jgi:hypothetical protein
MQSFHHGGWSPQIPEVSILSVKSSLLLFAAGWVLLAVATQPAQASDTTQISATPSTAFTETFPLFDGNVPASQAQLLWLAAREDAGMQATIGYIGSVNGSTGTLSSIREDFVNCRESISLAATPVDIRNGLTDLRRITESFRGETDARLREAGGNPEILRELVKAAPSGNPVVTRAEDQYWETRMHQGLSDLDQWAGQAESTITQLKENGYETTSAQEKLTEITTMRSTLETAFRTRNDTDIDQARKTIHDATVEYAQTLRGAKKIVPEREMEGNLLDLGEGVLTRSGMMNANLTSLGINCTKTRVLVEAGHARIATTVEQVNAGDVRGARTTLAQLNETIRSLRDEYRVILVREDLPLSTAQGVLSVAQSLDVMSVRLGAF